MASLTAIQSDASKVFGHLRQSGFEAKEGHPCWMELGETLKETKIPEDKILELTVNSGANECFSNQYFHEIQCDMNEIYNVKKKLENSISNFLSTEIEWVPINKIELLPVEKEEIINFLGILDDDDDVQNVYTNAKL